MTDYSVLMSVYKKEKAPFLKEAIESMVKQTVKPSDFVLVCDGPLNESLDKVILDFEKSYPGLFNVIRLEKNGGLAAALNTGIKYCKCDIVARMDSDDVSRFDRMEIELEAMEEQKADIVGSNVNEFVGNVSNVVTKRVLPECDEDIKHFAKKRNPFNHPTVVFKKQLVENIGGYPLYDYFEDYALWVTLLSGGAKGYNVMSELVNMRSDEGMYDRRGGLSYVKCIFNFQKYIRVLGYVGRRESWIQAMARAAVSLAPTSLRKKLYQRHLRQK